MNAGMNGGYVPLTFKRGDDAIIGFRVTDMATGEAIDLTGYTGRFLARYAANSGGVLIDGVTTASSSITGIKFTAPADGWLQLQVMKEALEAIPETRDLVALAYNIRLTAPDGYESTFISGPAEIEPEVFVA